MENVSDNMEEIPISQNSLHIFDFLKNIRIKRLDPRRFWPLIVFGLLILVTISHEASYAASFEIGSLEFMGWPYAIAINIAIFVSENFMRLSSVKNRALWVFIAATLGSGLMNVAYIHPWDIVGWQNQLFAWVYALLPTTLIVLVGWLSSGVNKIATSQEKRWETEANKEDSKYICFCDAGFDKPIQLANHTKQHTKELRELNVEKAIDALGYLKSAYPDAKKYPSIGKVRQWLGIIPSEQNENST